MDEKELNKLIQTQKEEIASLKDLIINLQSQLGEQIVNEEVDLKSYYLNQYLKKADDIMHANHLIFKQELEKLEDIKEALTNEEAMRKLEIMKNESLQKELNDLNEMINKSYLDNETKNFVFESSEVELTNKIKQLVLQIEKQWEKIALGIKDYKETGQNGGALIEVIVAQKNKVLSENGTDIAKLSSLKKELLDITTKAKLEKKELNSYLENLKIKQSSLQQELSLGKSIPKINQLEEINNQFAMLNKNQTNLKALFQEVIEKHQKQLADEYIRLSLIGSTPKEIALALEVSLNDKLKELSNTQTEEMKLEIKNKRLVSLTADLALLNEKQIEKEQKEIAYNHLQGLYINVQKNVQEIEDYLLKTKEVINQNKRYQMFYESYLSYQTNNVNYKNKLNDLFNELKRLQNRRSIIVHDPFSKETLISIDNKIKEAQENYQMTEQQLALNEEQFLTLTNQEELKKLVGVIDEKERYEKKLPEFYEQMQELRNLIDDYHQKLLGLKDELKDYQAIKDEIEALTNEFNH